MQISSRFTIAVHILLCLELYQHVEKLTSEYLAGSIGVNPVVVRRILAQLKSYGLVNIQRGSGGATLNKPIAEVSFYDVYQAVEISQGNFFNFHEQPNPNCPVGRNIHQVLDNKLELIQKQFEDNLKQIPITSLVADLQEIIAADSDLN